MKWGSVVRVPNYVETTVVSFRFKEEAAALEKLWRNGQKSMDKNSGSLKECPLSLQVYRCKL